MKPIYIIDFSNFLYRFGVFSITKNICGVSYDMSSIYGFMKSLKFNTFNDILIALDGYPAGLL